MTEARAISDGRGAPMPNDEVKLLPCPLCNVELFHNGGTELGDIYEHPANGCAIQVAWFTATPEWVAKWNRRAIPSTVSGETFRAELDDILDEDAPNKWVWKNFESMDEWLRGKILPLLRRIRVANHEARGDGVRAMAILADALYGQGNRKPGDTLVDLAEAVVSIAKMAVSDRSALPALGDGRAEIAALLDAYDAETRALPLGHEMPTRGASTYNWRRSVVDDLRRLAGLSLEQGEKP